MNFSEHTTKSYRSDCLANSRPYFFQPKLRINRPNDPFEREADAVAENIVRMEPGTSVTRPFVAKSIQSKCAHCEEEEKNMQRKEMNHEEVAADGSLEQYVDGLSNS